MDINTLRSLTTLVSLVVFVGIVWWALSKQRAKDFEQAAHLPFEQD
ncbi:cbb3-type cytochrome c oxidase subunit 3 [Curvibacter sp. CHRR-16]|nr:cbb3-type cytochrome c oxidase subunit 3 [Curvibacter sp. CHRR-16]MBT0570667.1 cbb3-type cytochrome c oxidase subunit 3 [Curvibacter sp. CHRR-16]